MKRGIGILMPIFSLPSVHGIGDFGPQALRFIDLLSRYGVSYWQILPLNAGNPSNDESPYFSVSAFAINPLLISLEKLHDAGFLTKEEIEPRRLFPDDAIRYGEVRSMKMPLLELAADRFRGTESFDEFCRLHRYWLDDFALFDVMQSTNATSWPMWPKPIAERDLQSIATNSLVSKNEIRRRKIIQFFAFSQWLELHRYCADRYISIIGDMPIYVAFDSADTWSNTTLFKLDMNYRPIAVSGVPPDYFSATGQLWNNPIYDWSNHLAQGFQWWVHRMKHLFTLYDYVRIDHFRGLIQYWAIPDGQKSAVNGKWEAVPTMELFDTLRAEINPFPVVCENLGVITDDVRSVMKHYGFTGMKVLQFAFGDDEPHNPNSPFDPDENCLIYTATHDNMPTLGWLRSCATAQELSRIHRTLGYCSDEKEIVWRLIAIALKSSAAVAVFPLQDILTLDGTARINNPAVSQGNWRWRWKKQSVAASAAFLRLHDLACKHHR